MANKKASSSKSKSKAAKAAVEEVNPTPDGKTIEWRGCTFKLPDELPKSLSFRLSQIEEAESPQPMLGLLQMLLERGEEGQYALVIREIERADDEEKAMGEAYELINGILQRYGTSEEKSGASQDS